MAHRQELLQRQRVLAEFGAFVLQCDDLEQILAQACRLVSEALGTEFAKILEIERERGTALVRAGIGWNDHVIGHARIQLNDRSSEAYAIETGEPLITLNIANEDRFDFPDFMVEHGVVALVNVPILLHGREVFGVLQVDCRSPREFGQDEVDFLRTYSMVLGPVIDRLEKLRELEHTSAIHRMVVENARDYAILLSDPEDRVTAWLPGAAAVFGWSEAEMLGKPASMLFTAEDRAAGVPEQECAEAARNGKAPDVRWHVRKDGSRVFIDGQTTALRSSAGELTGFMKIGQDVTDRRASDERQQVLVAELQHRTRNLMSIVRSIAEKTARASADLPDFRERFRDRMEALARVQGLLSRLTENTRVTFDELLETELYAMDGSSGGVTLDGPKGVAMRSSTVQTLAMALHELATNAVKYGALSQAGGTLSIKWHLEETVEDQRPLLRIDWREEGVTMPGADATLRRGQGRELIEKALPYQLSARTTYTLGPEGVHCTIALPVSGHRGTEGDHG